MDSSYSPFATLSRLFLLNLILLFVNLSQATQASNVKGVDLGNPAIDVIPSLLAGQLPIHSPKYALYCERVKVSGHSRLELGSYARSFRVTLVPSAVIPERLHGRIQVCFHPNASLGLCQCEKDEWKAVQKGMWNSVTSPYGERYVDVKFIGEISGSVTIAVEEDLQQWRFFCLAMGFLLLLLAPVISSWVPFYYSTSMAIGVFLVVIIILFQFPIIWIDFLLLFLGAILKGMKLLPTGRKNILYLSLYGSVLGAGTFLLHHISLLVNSILVNFGLSEDMHNPVYLFVLVGIVLAGAALGYWIVRKFVISKDGSVDVGVAQFVKWAMRIVATTFIFQSTLDTPLAMLVVVSSYTICFLINGILHRGGGSWVQRGRRTTAVHNRAEFLSRSAEISPGGKKWNTPKNLHAWYNSPVKGLTTSPYGGSRTGGQRNYFSTFHKTSKRKKFTRKEWEEFTRESTQQAVAEWAASPEVANWLVENADRIQLLPSDCSSDDEVAASESDSTDETASDRGKQFSLFSWLVAC